MKLELSVKNQSIETSGITKDYKQAFCEYIWNGFEANATHVDIKFEYNKLGGVNEVIIQDDGDGIKYETISDTFGTFLASQKNGLSLQMKSKANKGKGRFSCFGFASDIQWDTTVVSEDELVAYHIFLNSANKNECELTEPIKVDASTGTIVKITGIDDLNENDVNFEALEDTFLKAFAWYLYLNKDKGLSLTINGQKIDYTKYIDLDNSITETSILESNIFIITLVVWQEKIKENFCSYYLDEQGALCGKDTTKFNRNTVNFNHSVYVKSSFFNGKDNISLNKSVTEIDGQISIDEAEKENKILKNLRKKLQELICQRMDDYMIKRADKAIDDMIKRDSFPSFSNDIYGEMRKKDLIQVTKELYRLESSIFYNLKPIQEKSFLSFLNLLLNSEERENILSIVEEIVELSAEQRASFSDILKRTKLSNIVDSIKFIEDRYRVIEALKRIIYDLTDYANERDHVQKIVEQHYWLFGEQYNLVTSDQRMQKALEQYLYLLYGDSAPQAVLTPDEEEMRRMDIFACAARKAEDATGTEIQENLVVELKAPKITLTKKVLRQIEDYMDFVRKQPQFNSQYRRWKFIAVCKDVDDDVRSRYIAKEAMGKKGLVACIENYEVYALTWDDVFKSFEIRHSFLLDKLKMDQAAIAADLEASAGCIQSRNTANIITHEICTA